MLFLDLPSEMRLAIYDAVLQPLHATPEHYDTYVFPEEWPQKSFADYHSLLLTNKQISGEVQHFFLTDYVDKVTVFFDDCLELYGFAGKLCVYSQQGKRLQAMRLSLRSPTQGVEYSALGTMRGAFAGLYWCFTDTLRNTSAYADPPTIHQIYPLWQPHQRRTDIRRGEATICALTYQTSDDAPAVLHTRGVEGPREVREYSGYAELRTTFFSLSWVPWVSVEGSRRRGEHERISKEGAEVMERVREMLRSPTPDEVQHEGLELIIEEA